MQRAVDRAAIVSVMSVFALCLTVPAFAQTHTERWRDTWAVALDAAVRPDTLRHGIARVYAADADRPDSSVAPANLIVPEMYRSVIDAMLRRSPTFRRQCLRLANAPRLTIVLQSRMSTRRGSRVRARTLLAPGADGKLDAVIDLVSLENPVELIAHEIEHVIEQLDGIDLPSRALLPDSGVHACDEGAFETRRAVRVGQVVAEEVRSAQE